MTTKSKKAWRELGTGKRVGIVVGAAIELLLTIKAGRDLWRRPTEQVRGPKAVWAAALAIQPLGPLSYLLFGRRKG